ncbi:MAG: hypothetical protein QOE69_1760 [Thermoleophilaceae bacterium]|nr:hypothetical protein [Thermoleophilaceae bacterium]
MTSGSSAAGSAWAMEPPTVPRLRIAAWAMWPTASASSGQLAAIEPSCSTVRCVVSAPILSAPFCLT